MDESLDLEGHRGHLYFLFEYDVRPGMTRDIANGRPWKRFMPTEFSLSLWDREIDRRYDDTYKKVWYANNAASIPVWTPDRKARSRYLVITSSDYTEKLFPSLKKFIDDTSPDRQKEQGQRDFI